MGKVLQKPHRGFSEVELRIDGSSKKFALRGF
jgi:hypothetical protein